MADKREKNTFMGENAIRVGQVGTNGSRESGG